MTLPCMMSKYIPVFESPMIKILKEISVIAHSSKINQPVILMRACKLARRLFSFQVTGALLSYNIAESARENRSIKQTQMCILQTCKQMSIYTLALNNLTTDSQVQTTKLEYTKAPTSVTLNPFIIVYYEEH